MFNQKVFINPSKSTQVCSEVSNAADKVDERDKHNWSWECWENNLSEGEDGDFEEDKHKFKDIERTKKFYLKRKESSDEATCCIELEDVFLERTAEEEDSEDEEEIIQVVWYEGGSDGDDEAEKLVRIVEAVTKKKSNSKFTLSLGDEDGSSEDVDSEGDETGGRFLEVKDSLEVMGASSRSLRSQGKWSEEDEQVSSVWCENDQAWLESLELEVGRLKRETEQEIVLGILEEGALGNIDVSEVATCLGNLVNKIGDEMEKSKKVSFHNVETSSSLSMTNTSFTCTKGTSEELLAVYQRLTSSSHISEKKVSFLPRDESFIGTSSNLDPERQKKASTEDIEEMKTEKGKCKKVSFHDLVKEASDCEFSIKCKGRIDSVSENNLNQFKKPLLNSMNSKLKLDMSSESSFKDKNSKKCPFHSQISLDSNFCYEDVAELSNMSNCSNSDLQNRETKGTDPTDNDGSQLKEKDSENNNTFAVSSSNLVDAKEYSKDLQNEDINESSIKKDTNSNPKIVSLDDEDGSVKKGLNLVEEQKMNSSEKSIYFENKISSCLHSAEASCLSTQSNDSYVTSSSGSSDELSGRETYDELAMPNDTSSGSEENISLIKELTNSSFVDDQINSSGVTDSEDDLPEILNNECGFESRKLNKNQLMTEIHKFSENEGLNFFSNKNQFDFDNYFFKEDKFSEKETDTDQNGAVDKINEESEAQNKKYLEDKCTKQVVENVTTLNVGVDINSNTTFSNISLPRSENELEIIDKGVNKNELIFNYSINYDTGNIRETDFCLEQDTNLKSEFEALTNIPPAFQIRSETDKDNSIINGMGHTSLTLPENIRTEINTSFKKEGEQEQTSLEKKEPMFKDMSFNEGTGDCLVEVVTTESKDENAELLIKNVINNNTLITFENKINLTVITESNSVVEDSSSISHKNSLEDANITEDQKTCLTKEVILSKDLQNQQEGKHLLTDDIKTIGEQMLSENNQLDSCLVEEAITESKDENAELLFKNNINNNASNTFENKINLTVIAESNSVVEDNSSSSLKMSLEDAIITDHETCLTKEVILSKDLQNQQESEHLLTEGIKTIGERMLSVNNCLDSCLVEDAITESRNENAELLIKNDINNNTLDTFENKINLTVIAESNNEVENHSSSSVKMSLEDANITEVHETCLTKEVISSKDLQNQQERKLLLTEYIKIKDEQMPSENNQIISSLTVEAITESKDENAELLFKNYINNNTFDAFENNINLTIIAESNSEVEVNSSSSLNIYFKDANITEEHVTCLTKEVILSKDLQNQHENKHLLTEGIKKIDEQMHSEKNQLDFFFQGDITRKESSEYDKHIFDSSSEVTPTTTNKCDTEIYDLSVNEKIKSITVENEKEESRNQACISDIKEIVTKRLSTDWEISNFGYIKSMLFDALNKKLDKIFEKSPLKIEDGVKKVGSSGDSAEAVRVLGGMKDNFKSLYNQYKGVFKMESYISGISMAINEPCNFNSESISSLDEYDSAESDSSDLTVNCFTVSDPVVSFVLNKYIFLQSPLQYDILSMFDSKCLRSINLFKTNSNSLLYTKTGEDFQTTNQKSMKNDDFNESWNNNAKITYKTDYKSKQIVQVTEVEGEFVYGTKTIRCLLQMYTDGKRTWLEPFYVTYYL